MKQSERDDRTLWFRALANLEPRISWDDSDARVDEDVWCELVWLSCDDEGDSMTEQRDMCTLLDKHGVIHENTATEPEFCGYSEYTPDPGWVMRLKVNLMDTGGFSNELTLARELVIANKDLIQWRKVAHNYSAELKQYADCVHEYVDHDCGNALCHFVRAAYMKNPDLYDMKPGQFPGRGSSEFASLMKAYWPEKEINAMALEQSPLLSMIKKEGQV